MPTERYRPLPEPDEDAYEDAWYRALKAKASNRFADRKDDTTDAPPGTSPSALDRAEDDAGSR
jgi:hypothetical protein